MVSWHKLHIRISINKFMVRDCKAGVQMNKASTLKASCNIHIYRVPVYALFKVSYLKYEWISWSSNYIKTGQIKTDYREDMRELWLPFLRKQYDNDQRISFLKKGSLNCTRNIYKYQ